MSIMFIKDYFINYETVNIYDLVLGSIKCSPDYNTGLKAQVDLSSAPSFRVSVVKWFDLSHSSL